MKTIANKKQSSSGFTGAHLKWLALFTMLIDHIGLVLLETGLLPFIANAVLGGSSYEYIPADYTRLSNINLVLRLIGRVSFPLYCFLLVEGFSHTKSVPKYILRLGLLAVLSEIPFNLARYNSLFCLTLQNVFFTLFIGLLVIWGMQYTGRRFPKSTFLPYAIALAGMLCAHFLQTDYGAFGILLIAMLYLLGSDKKQLCIFGVISTIWEYTAPLAFLPIYFYNGERGKQPSKWFFYLFYPVHLLLLVLLRLLIL